MFLQISQSRAAGLDYNCPQLSCFPLRVMGEAGVGRLLVVGPLLGRADDQAGEAQERVATRKMSANTDRNDR